jgi:hypothetical protein
MKKCLAFSAISGSREAWIPCVRRAESGYLLCPRHCDVVAGVMIGLHAAHLAAEAKKKAVNSERRQRKANRRSGKLSQPATCEFGASRSRTAMAGNTKSQRVRCHGKRRG